MDHYVYSLRELLTALAIGMVAGGTLLAGLYTLRARPPR